MGLLLFLAFFWEQNCTVLCPSVGVCSNELVYLHGIFIPFLNECHISLTCGLSHYRNWHSCWWCNRWEIPVDLFNHMKYINTSTKCHWSVCWFVPLTRHSRWYTKWKYTGCTRWEMWLWLIKSGMVSFIFVWLVFLLIFIFDWWFNLYLEGGGAKGE